MKKHKKIFRKDDVIIIKGIKFIVKFDYTYGWDKTIILEQISKNKDKPKTYKADLIELKTEK